MCVLVHPTAQNHHDHGFDHLRFPGPLLVGSCSKEQVRREKVRLTGKGHADGVEEAFSCFPAVMPAHKTRVSFPPGAEDYGQSSSSPSPGGFCGLHRTTCISSFASSTGFHHPCLVALAPSSKPVVVTTTSVYTVPLLHNLCSSCLLLPRPE